MLISVEQFPAEPKIEVVECKGKGHPDTLCDTLCELCSNALSRYYIKHFGKVLHHNIDKGTIVAGSAMPKFGGGKIIKPMEIIIVGRATAKVGKKRVPVEQIVKKTVKEYMKQFKFAKFKVTTKIKEGAGNLKEIFKKEVQVANDTSIGISHYPFSPTEHLVFSTARYLESSEFRKLFPMAGYDIKVMGVRIGEKTSLTIALAFVDRFIKSLDDYREVKHRVKEHIERLTNVEVAINTLDSYRDENSVYLTVSGLSAEMGDDGQVGRGNRYNGLITPNRAMSIEAVAGKNISHPGKIYQVMAYKIAKEIVNSGAARKAEVMLLTQIGKPLSEPQLVAVFAADFKDKEDIIKIVNTCFAQLQQVQQNLIEGKEI